MRGGCSWPWPDPDSRATHGWMGWWPGWMQAERTAMLQRMGGERRELSVAVSVEASVTAPLMTAEAEQLLGLLGVLPDGVAREDLTALLPGSGLAAAAPR